MIQDELDNSNNNNLVDLMKINFSYPDPDESDFQYQIYKKREYYINKVPFRKEIKDYPDVKAYRDKECGGEKFQLHTQQSLLSNYINPDTPYTGLLIFHGVGTGKTCAAFAIAENFKDMVKKYGTKIHILLTGPLIREQWKNELVEKCAKETYLKDFNQTIGYIDENERNKAIKQAKVNSMQFYKIMSLRSFQKKVMGQKIIEKNKDNSKKKVYRKTSEGELERDIAIDKIESLNNTLLIIDEAHNLTGNEYGESVRKIIRNSKNLKVILLTATPMKNLGDDIIELINLLRPVKSQIEREMVFNGSGHTMEFRENGREYLKKMVNGYISHFRGANPLIYADQVDVGEIPPTLNFTKVIRCYMSDFQLTAYQKILKFTNDTLDRKSQSVANFVFPGLNSEKTELEGISGEEGINNIRNQLKSNKQLLLNKINQTFYGNKYPNPNELLVDREKSKSLGGKIFKLPYLEKFSVKFFTCLNTINETVSGKRGAGLIFIYSNLVKVGIELFKETLLQNGYLEFSENKNYNILDDTKDAITGKPYIEFKESDNIQNFYPATFIAFTGKSDEANEDQPEIKMNTLKIFNHIDNKEGKHIKIVLGSRVMNEGITLHNIKDVHILDVYYNFGRVYQVIGRAIRHCVHYKITDENNPYPKVNVYKYVVSLPEQNQNGGQLTQQQLPILSAEEELYKKAEYKYILVKDIERSLKEMAIDCPLNYHANIFPEEIEKNKNCVTPDKYALLTDTQKEKTHLCPATCDFQNCSYKCHNAKLNNEFFDGETNAYKKLNKNELDYTTFTSTLKKNEIKLVKDKIKELYKYKYVYSLDEFEDIIKSSYSGERAELFEEFFIYQALNDLIPLDENDFNNFQDTIFDKYNVPGYLIYRNKYYIFQPFEENEDVPMWYRSNFQTELNNDLTIFNYMKNSDIYKKITKTTSTSGTDSYSYSESESESESKSKSKSKSDSDSDSDSESESDSRNRSLLVKKNKSYDFSNMEYYNNKDEFVYVGIIDRGSSRIKTISENKNDIFKIRPSREKILIKKRGTGIPSLKGAVCNTSKDRNLLIKIAKEIDIKNIDKYMDDTRISICDQIKKRLLFLEKFSTNKQKNKLVYMIIPTNHPIYPFPFNLEDRAKHIIDDLQSKISISLKTKIENIKNGIFEDVRDKEFAKYKITINNGDDLKEYFELLKSKNFVKENDSWVLIIE